MQDIVFRTYDSAAEIKDLWAIVDNQITDYQRVNPYRGGYWRHTFYQTYEWNAFYESRISRLKRLLGIKRTEYIVAFRGPAPVAIIPLLLSRFPSKVEFLSYKVAGANDVIMPDGGEGEDVCRAAVEYMAQRYKNRRFFFCDVPGASPVGKALSAVRGVRIQERQSFHLPVAGFASFDAYKSTLSKSLCQTIRTGRNHLSRTGGWRFFVCGREGMPSPEYLLRLWRLYFARKNTWNRRSELLYNDMVLRFEALRTQRSAVSRSLEQLDAARLCVLEIEGRPAAFAVFYLHDGRAVVPKLAIDNTFKKYSPGLVMLDELVKWCFDNGVQDFDLSRGYESYKPRMGCVPETIYRFAGHF